MNTRTWRIGTDTLPSGKIRATSRGIGQGRKLTSESSRTEYASNTDEHRAVARELARRIRPNDDPTISLLPVTGGMNRQGLQGYDWEVTL